ncbi:hypothetical protein EON62_06635 [archaeon]|nr:MAG: hypothetical protein EON62_06635 [archaeon]
MFGNAMQVKATRDAKKVAEALERLSKSAALTESTGKGSNENNLLRLAVEAARVRCTLGEISDAVRGVRSCGWHAFVARRSLSILAGARVRVRACVRACRCGVSTSRQRAWCRVRTAAPSRKPWIWRRSSRRRWPWWNSLPRMRAVARASSSPRWARTAMIAARR